MDWNLPPQANDSVSWFRVLSLCRHRQHGPPEGLGKLLVENQEPGISSSTVFMRRWRGHPAGVTASRRGSQGAEPLPVASRGLESSARQEGVSHCSSSRQAPLPVPRPAFTLVPRGTRKLPEHLLNIVFTQCPKEHSVFSEHCSTLSPVGRSQRLFY